MLIVLAKVGKPELVGLYALGLAVALPVFVFSSLRLEHVHVTDARGDHRFRDFLFLRTATSLLALPTLLVIVLIVGYSWEKSTIIMAVGVSQTVMSIREIFLARMRKAERLDCQALSHVVLGVGGLAVFATVLWTTSRLLPAVLAMAGVRFLVMLMVDAPNAARMHVIDPEKDAGDGRAPIRQRLRLMWLALPLGLVAVMVSLTENIPRYLVEHHLGEAALGYFAAIASIPMIGFIVTEAAAQSASPRLARYYITNRPAYIRLTGKLMVLGLALGVAGIGAAYFLGSWLLGVLFTPEYADYATLFVWLMAIGGLWYVWGFCETSLTAARYFKTQMPVNAAVALTVLAAGVVLAPRFGMIGAAWAMLAAAVVGIAGTAGAVIYAAKRPQLPPIAEFAAEPVS